jgi:hypothetical protein
MNARSLEELSNFLDEDLKRRKLEISALKFAVASARSHQAEPFRRAALLLLYAHWEGFIRAAATAYCVYVNHQGHSCAHLTANFVAVALRSKIEQLAEVKKSTIVTAITQELVGGLSSQATFNWTGDIETRSNVDSEVLREILCLIGLDYTPYATYAGFLDGKLLKSRNDIAHGKLVVVDEETYEDVHEKVSELLTRIKDDVENAVATKKFLRS